MLKKRQTKFVGMPLLAVFAAVGLSLLLSCSTTPFSDYERAQSLSNEGRYSEAIETFSRSIALQPDDRRAYLGRAYAFEKIEEYEQAVSDYGMAISLKPTDPQVYFARGLAYDILGKTDRAVQDCSMTISMKPSDGDAYYRRGVDREKMGDADGAVADFRKTLELGRAEAEVRLQAEARLKALEGAGEMANEPAHGGILVPQLMGR